MHRLFTKPSNKQTQVHQPASGTPRQKDRKEKDETTENQRFR